LIIVGLLAPNETVEKPLVLKMFKKTSHNRLKNSQNIAKMFFGTPKTRCFSAFLSHFSKIIFERRLIRQFQQFAFAKNGAGAGGDSVWEQKKPEARKSIFSIFRGEIRLPKSPRPRKSPPPQLFEMIPDKCL
jgi:hypothetical protein